MFKFIQRYGFTISIVLNVLIIVIVCILHGNEWKWDDSKVIGHLIQVLIAGFTTINGVLLLLSLLWMPNNDWGHLGEQKTNVYLGCLVSIIASGYFVIKSILHYS